MLGKIGLPRESVKFVATDRTRRMDTWVSIGHQRRFWVSVALVGLLAVLMLAGSAGRPSTAEAASVPSASDGSTLWDQPQEIQKLFTDVYGADAAQVWAEQHSHELEVEAERQSSDSGLTAKIALTPRPQNEQVAEKGAVSEPTAEATPTPAQQIPTPEPQVVTPESQSPASEPQSAQKLSNTDSKAPLAVTGNQLRVGIQAGHWECSDLPAELASLRSSTGASGAGWKEVDINLDIARRVVAKLGQAGIQADLIPATVPVAYKADAFVALHGDSNGNSAISGFKVARATASKIPEKDDALVAAIKSEYQAATGLKEHPQSITQNMLRYYAFDNQRLAHAIDPSTPGAIVEMGFLTNLSDRTFLTNQADTAARGITAGILRFLGFNPAS